MLPIVRDVIEQEGAGEADGGVGFAEVEVDARGMGELGREYFVSLVLFFLVGFLGWGSTFNCSLLFGPFFLWSSLGLA